MPIPFIMPKFDMDQEKATIVSWTKTEGEQVKYEETVLVVETDKVAIDVPCPGTGTLVRIRYQAGDIVPVATVIAYILKEGETTADLPIDTLAPELPVVKTLKPTRAVHLPVTPVAARLAKEKGVDLSRVHASGERITREDVEKFLADQVPSREAGKIPATPAARRLAQESHVDMKTLHGSGPLGRVQASDVLAAASQGAALQKGAGERQAEIVPLSSIRRTIAEKMQQSFRETPHIALTVDVDMTAAENTRKVFSQQSEKLGNPHIKMTSVICNVVAWALVRNPYLNASFKEQSIYLWKDVNIGIATAVPQGLMVPVLRGVDRLGVNEINIRLADLAERARKSKLRLEDVQDGTFTISNLGMYGIRQFQAVINPPECAILAVGSLIRRPIVVDDQDRVEIRPMLSITLSADHRVVDGVVASKFLSDLVTGLETPGMLWF